ncbi:MAG: hypothetical protein RLY97_348, partial [Pseudomonadota bacterium]
MIVNTAHYRGGNHIWEVRNIDRGKCAELDGCADNDVHKLTLPVCPRHHTKLGSIALHATSNSL